MIEVRNIVLLLLLILSLLIILNECCRGIIVDLPGWVISLLYNSSNDNNIALVLEFITTSKLRNELYIYCYAMKQDARQQSKYFLDVCTIVT